MSARPFTEHEYLTLLAHFTNQGRTRDSALLALGCGTGFRIQELLAVTVGHVWERDAVSYEITLARRNLKGGMGAYRKAVRSRRVPLGESVRKALGAHLAVIGTDDPARPIFGTNRSGADGMDRSQAFRTLVAACIACGIDAARISTHSMRKTFARRVYQASGHDLIRTQRALGHASPITTARYLETDSADLDRLILDIAA
jgi:integrase